MMQKVTVGLVLCVLGMSAISAPAADTRIGPKGQVYVNGKAVIPLGVWTQPPYLFEYYRQLGMNCIIGPDPARGSFRDARSVSEAAAAAGLGLVADTNKVRDDRSHPAFWGRLDGILDGRYASRMPAAYARARREEPNHLVMVNIAIHPFLSARDPNAYREGLRHTDAVISHVWPECMDPNAYELGNVGRFVDRVRGLCKDRPGGEVSIWPDINPHPWIRKNGEGGTHYRSPTTEELRYQIWLALLRGADGLCFFPISFEPFTYAQIPTKNEQELAWNSRLIEKMTPALTADESALKIEVVSDRKDGLLDWTTRTAGGKHYVFLLNGERREQTVTLRAPELGARWQVRDAIQEKAVPSTGGAVSEKLPGLSLRIWELAPAGGAAASPATQGTSSPRSAQP